MEEIIDKTKDIMDEIYKAKYTELEKNHENILDHEIAKPLIETALKIMN